MTADSREFPVPTAFRLAVAVLATGLLVSGCGDGASPATASPTTPASSSTPSSSTPTPVVTTAPEATTTSTIDQNPTCTDYLVITARGTSEPLADSNLLSGVARQIAAAHPGRTRHYDVPYPADAVSLSATPGDAFFGASADEGVRLMVGELNVAARKCPQQRSIVMGYSQGALVAADALISASVRNAGREQAELTPAAAQNIDAVVLYGDPRFVGGEPFNAGDYDSGIDGMVTDPRPAGALEAFADRLRDYCVADDFVCQSGGRFAPHVAYFTNGMREQGAQFALARMRAR
ncbi:cutinase family protein [Kineosporia sp. NBRC 101731]|uniref:cutinase family protein n=1 Tax=Kineosporia sp. NBRC 101731 TaxID=3032199 RepID=UPI0025574D4B|nr:cutinase family protein [Kineosporia sp. NBRC 101731]